MKLFEVEQPITPAQLNALEKALDALFKSLGIDVEFTRHFIDRVNDERNQEQITMPELINMFKKEYKRWGKPIAQMGPDSEAVMKDLESDINIPFVLKWDRDNQELDLVAKSVMRKKNFKTSNKEFPVESIGSSEHNEVKAILDRHGIVSLDDIETGTDAYEELFVYYMDSGEMPYGVMKARDGDPEEWIVDRISDLGLITEGDLNAWYAEQYAKELAEKDGKVWDRMPYGDKEDYRKIANKKYGVVKSENADVPTQKGRDAKHDVLTSKSRNTVLKQIKKSANKQRRADSKKAIEEDETPTPMRRISDEEKLAMFNELKAGDTVYLWYDSAFKRGEKYKPFKMGRRTKSEKYNLSKFSMQQISAEGIPAGVKFFLYKRGDKVSLAMGDMAATLVDMQTDLGEYKISSKKPLANLGGYGDKKLAKKQPAVGDGLSEDEEFYVIVEYKKGQPVRQSDPLRVLDNLASRKDNMPFPIKFIDGEEIKVTPELARRFTMAYHDIARPEQKDLIKKYLKTKDGFKKIVNQMQLKKDDFGKNAGANLAGLSRDNDLVR